jgi:hypothetical protein
MKDTIVRFQQMGRSATSSDARAVYDWLYGRMESHKHGSLQGIASSVRGQMNALLKRSGHLPFGRDECNAFNRWVGLPPVGETVSKADAQACEALAELGL